MKSIHAHRSHIVWLSVVQQHRIALHNEVAQTLLA
jgi:hypothetical protein